MRGVPHKKNLQLYQMKTHVCTINFSLPENRDIVKLICPFCNLKYFPLEIANLHNLKYLYCGNNSLTFLPPEIGRCVNLRELHCYANSLTCLPAELKTLVHLRKLDCSYNKISELPRELGYLKKLRVLICSNNQITYIPPEIGRIRLKILDSSKNYLPSTFTRKKLRRCTRIQRFMAEIILARYLGEMYINYKYNPDINMNKIMEMRKSDLWE